MKRYIIISWSVYLRSLPFQIYVGKNKPSMSSNRASAFLKASTLTPILLSRAIGFINPQTKLIEQNDRVTFFDSTKRDHSRLETKEKALQNQPT